MSRCRCPLFRTSSSSSRLISLKHPFLPAFTTKPDAPPLMHNEDPVDFRLTPNLQHFITLTGIEGILTASMVAIGRGLCQPEVSPGADRSFHPGRGVLTTCSFLVNSSISRRSFLFSSRTRSTTCSEQFQAKLCPPQSGSDPPRLVCPQECPSAASTRRPGLPRPRLAERRRLCQQGQDYLVPV